MFISFRLKVMPIQIGVQYLVRVLHKINVYIVQTKSHACADRSSIFTEGSALQCILILDFVQFYTCMSMHVLLQMVERCLLGFYVAQSLWH